MEPAPHSADLPIQVTPLIGRDQELAEATAMLRREGVRLVTLTGPGGIGKTRLAIAVAEAIGADYPDGVHLIPLASIRDPSLVVPAIAQALNVREEGGTTLREALPAAIGDRKVLLILDNFEQVEDAAEDLAWLLGACARVELLVTSRVILRVRGEHEYVVPPLPLPTDAPAADGLGANPAIQLFVERARQVQPDLDLSATNGPVLAEICRRLDGIPLAIELAAARVKVLPPAAMLDRLEHRLPLLVGGPRDLPDRLRTMRDAIAWSYDLLSPEEQALFRRLSIFTGPFTLYEAESIISGGDPDEYGDEAQLLTLNPSPPVLDLIENLVNSSLIQQEELEGEPRFLMLETIREFGLDQLGRAGEQEIIRDRHSDFFIGFAEAAALRLRGAERTPWLGRLERAHDNFRAASTWLTDRNDPVRAARLAGALWQFWWWRSHIAEGRQRLERVLALPGVEAAGPAWARVLTGAGALAETQGDYGASERYHERAVGAWHQLGEQRGLAISMLFRWLVAFNADDQERMTTLSNESLRLFEELGDTWGIAMSYMQQGVQAMRRVDVDEADQVLTKAIALFESINDGWGVAISKGVAGNVATDRRDFAAAAKLCNESLTTLHLLGDLWGTATVLPAVVRLAFEQGDFEHAVRLAGAVAMMHRTLGLPLKVPFRERLDRNLEVARTKLGEEKFNRFFAEGIRTSVDEAVQTALQPIGPGKEPALAAKRINPLAGTLSRREMEVLCVLVKGLTAKEIGDELFISESTVNTHIKHIYNKLDVENRAALIAFVFRNGLCESSAAA